MLVFKFTISLLLADFPTNNLKILKILILIFFFVGILILQIHFLCHNTHYADTNAPSLGEIYETIDSMLGKMKRIVAAKDPTLGFYEEHIRPIVMRR